MKDYKWAKGLSKSTVSNVLDCIPKLVEFNVNRAHRTVTCVITRETDTGVGGAVCSCLDKFDERVGKNIAARRAVLAIAEKRNSRPIRSEWDQFPGTWTKKRIDFLRSFQGMYKCRYVSYVG